MKTPKLLIVSAFSAFAIGQCGAALFFGDDFGVFSAGNLVGQNGWTQSGTSATQPIQVSGGQVVIPGNQTADNQDAIKLFPAVSPPASGTTSLFYGMQLSVSSAPTANSSYFAALYDGSSFYNFRLAARDSGANGFLIGARVNGQSGYPFGFGTVSLSYDQPHIIIVEADLVSGANNDVVKIFVDPTSADLSTLTPYATSTYSTGTVADPTAVGGFLLSQYGNSTGSTTSIGGNIIKAAAGDNFGEVLTAVPEPSSFALLLCGVGGWLVRRRMSR